uniref:Uncharacterized protein n=1 Tax=Poecilia formosa TaxID=48698 RepID=A0A096LUG0_POEFO
FVDYIPPARDAITLPRSVVYVLVGAMLIVMATYAIVGHLIKDLMHDLADWIFGPKPVEEDPEREEAEIEEERRLSISRVWRRAEDGGDGGCRHPSSLPPLRSAITSSYPGEKRMSTHSV